MSFGSPMPHLRTCLMPLAPQSLLPKDKRMIEVSTWSSAWCAYARQRAGSFIIAMYKRAVRALRRYSSVVWAFGGLSSCGRVVQGIDILVCGTPNRSA